MEQQAAEFISAVLTSGFNPTQLQQAPAVGTQAASSIAAIRRIVLDHGEAAVVADLQQQVQATTPVACKVNEYGQEQSLYTHTHIVRYAQVHTHQLTTLCPLPHRP